MRDSAASCRASRWPTSWVERSRAIGSLKDSRSACLSLDRALEISSRAFREESAADGRKGPRQVVAGALDQCRLLPTLVLIPGVYLLAGFIPGNSVSLLDYALERFAPAVDLGKVVVGQFSPLLLDGAFHLLPISRYPIPVYDDLLNATDKRRLGLSVPEDVVGGLRRRKSSDGTLLSDKRLCVSRRGRRPNGGHRHGIRKRSAALADWNSHSDHRPDCAPVASLNETARSFALKR